jgi:creatinine amidohydrolase/Fe(II)-dependent formamide hydrolase-like protein
MHQHGRLEKSVKLSLLTISEIQEYLTRNNSLIIPLGGLEPLGEIGAVGIPGKCSDALATEIAYQCGSLVTPLLPFASSPLFKAFAGCVSMGSSGYENILSYICSGYIYQGFKRILLLQSALMPDQTLEMILKRLKKYSAGAQVKLYNWQNDKRIISFMQSEAGASSFERLEIGMLSLAGYFDKEYVREKSFSGAPEELTLSQYKTWRKRGADPHKFRKLFPSGITSKKGPVLPSSDLGKKLFQYILNMMISEYSDFLKADTADAAQ